jgi:hypothetical protein
MAQNIADRNYMYHVYIRHWDKANDKNNKNRRSHSLIDNLLMKDLQD